MSSSQITEYPLMIKTLRYVEWTLIFVHALIFFTNYHPHVYVWQFANAVIVLTSFTCLTFLSFIFPIHRPLWQKSTYIFVEIILTLLFNAMGMRWDILIYFIIAKGCFLLRPKQIVITAILTGVLWNMMLVLSLPRTLEFERSHIVERITRLYDTHSVITRTVINDTARYTATVIFVILFCFVAIAERKSRQKAEVLAKEVETLAATLERTRIAREIHDSLGHTLTTLDVQLELAQRLRHKDSEKSLELLDTAKNLSGQALKDVRRAVQTMRQSDFDLNSALDNLVRQLKHNQTLKIDFNVNLPLLPLQTSHQLYCIIQEAFTNIQKHARATAVKLRGWSTVENVIIEVADNGMGFNPEVEYSGFGLRGMQERIKMLGGKLKIESNSTEGTIVQVTIPLWDEKSL